MEQHQKPIFYDERGRRWPAILRTWAALGLALSVLAAAFMASLVISPKVGPLPPQRGPVARPILPENKEKARKTYALSLRARRTREALVRHIRARRTSIPNRARIHQRKPLSVVAGFYVNWDATSYASLTANADCLTHLVPEWMHLSADGSRFTGEESRKVIAFADQHKLPILPLLNNVNAGDWDSNRIHSLLISPAAQQKLTAQIITYLKRFNFRGLNLDLEEAPAGDRDLLTAFVYNLAGALHNEHLLLSQDVPVDDPTYDLAALADACDFIVPMLYDEHDSTGGAGPIASQAWFEQQASKVYSLAPREKVVLGLGAYAYDWPHGQTGAKSEGYEEAVVDARDSGRKMQFDAASLNPHFSYTDDAGQDHDVWMLDAVTLYNELHSQRADKPLGAALWVLGSEDPSIWSFLRRDRLAAETPAANLSSISFKHEVDFEGKGEILKVKSTPSAGARVISTGARGLITSEKYTQYPSSYVIEQRGDQPRSICLTFDDGPDPRWTPKILDILQKYHVPATFFVTGSQAEANPAILRREYAEGHEIGNHTYYHPDLSQAGPTRVKLELDATQLAIETLTGHATRLFRPPYTVDTSPERADEIRPIIDAEKLGYVTVGSNIDPNDWARPGVHAILWGGKVGPLTEKDVTEVDGVFPTALAGLEPTADAAHIILLHDAGGDRTETLEALPKIIEGLKARGFAFTTVSGLMGYQTRDAMMPLVSGKDALLVGADRFSFELAFLVKSTLQWLFIIALILGISRTLFTGVFAVIQSRRASRERFNERYQPSVSVVIAAFNEARVIERTVRTLLDSAYRDVEIIVVDDGSTDDTAGVVRRAFADEPAVTLLSKPNGGKSTALNMGIARARGEIVIGLDADTMFAPDTIGLLVRHFDDPDVAAVAGNVKVGNRVNLWTIWQSLEYITSQNFDRRAYSQLNCVTVVPGAVGAWRKSVVLEAGGYLADTLAEDTDLTLRVRRLGYRIKTENAALAYTEAPDNVRSLARQRFRWAFGTLQCLWKHHDTLFRREYGTLGFVALPTLWIFQVALQAISPVVDVMIVMSLWSGNFRTVAAYYLVYFIVDLVGALLAVRLDREDGRLLFWMFLQRFVYRQVMYYVIFRSLMAAFRGHHVGWGKQQRKGTVTVGAK
ncbi:MAG TPA: polysaccharide deacetylase family protein [Armatimonadota bacterium]